MTFRSNQQPVLFPAGVLHAIMSWKATRGGTRTADGPHYWRQLYRLRADFIKTFGCEVENVPEDQFASAIDHLSRMIHPSEKIAIRTPMDRLSTLLRSHTEAVARGDYQTSSVHIAALLSAVEVVELRHPYG